MQLLKDRIVQDGKCFDGGILKVDSFINHQLDPKLMHAIGLEFSNRLQDLKIDKIITIEASGIAPAIMLGLELGIPVVFVKKAKPKTMANFITSKVYSFTKDTTYDVCVSSDYLKVNEKVVFIDDFLANGNAALGVKELIDKAGAHLVAMGFVIEKSFQSGRGLLMAQGVRIESLARIKELALNHIKFVE